MTIHALTIDLEDWHQLVHRHVTGELIGPTPQVVDDTHRLLDLLDESRVRATFFVVGYVAQAHPELVREVAARGHEIGSHTFSHRLLHTLDPAALRADLDRSRGQLQDLSGQLVTGFRAPEFSVRSLDHWCFSVLAESGFRYDSSVFPLPGARYGIPSAPRRPFAIHTSGGDVQEYPLAVWDVGGRTVPIAGGTYFRLLPGAVLRRGLRTVDAEQRTAVFYFHPYEFSRRTLWLSTLQPRQRRSATYLRFRLLHNLGTGSIARRLHPLLAEFAFAPLGEIHARSGSARA